MEMSLAGKNMENMFSTMQNQSLLGLVRKYRMFPLILIYGWLFLEYWLFALLICAFRNIKICISDMLSLLRFWCLLYSSVRVASRVLISLLCGSSSLVCCCSVEAFSLGHCFDDFAFILTSLSPSDLSRSLYARLMCSLMRWKPFRWYWFGLNWFMKWWLEIIRTNWRNSQISLIRKYHSCLITVQAGMVFHVSSDSVSRILPVLSLHSQRLLQD